MNNLIRHLTAREAESINREIKNSSSEFNLHTTCAHYSKVGALRDGSTVWLYFDEGFINLDKFPKTIEILKDIAISLNAETFSRVYIHKICPYGQIHKHKDTIQQYYHNVSRYQIFLDFPDNFVIIHNSDPVLPNTVISFNHLLDHQYINNSDQEVIIVVFDFLKKENICAIGTA